MVIALCFAILVALGLWVIPALHEMQYSVSNIEYEVSR